MHNIVVVGTGALGTSLAKLLKLKPENNVWMYGIDKQEAEEIRQGKNTKYFDESISIPKLDVYDDMKEALNGADCIVIAVPSFVMDKVIDQINSTLESEVIIINCSKGFYPGTQRALHVGIEKNTKDNKLVRGVVTLTGPSHAEELIVEMPTLLTAVSHDEECAKEVRTMFMSKVLRVYVQNDVNGAENGAAYKNVLAIISGMLTGLGYGDNSRAGLITRGLVEMRRYNLAQGGKDETVLGLSGIGDLIVTATSKHSRNFRYGKSLVETSEREPKETVEGLEALKVIYKISVEKNLELPLIQALYKIVFEKACINGLSKDMFTRDTIYE